MKNIDHEVSCPCCGWQPDGKAHWQCLCGSTWNVFSTAGRCPECFRVWEKTQCAPKAGGCNSWSPHMDWYGNLDDWLVAELSILPISQNEEKERRGSRGL